MDQQLFKKVRCNPGPSPKNMSWSTQDLRGGSNAGRVGRDAAKFKKTTAIHDILGKSTRT